MLRMKHREEASTADAEERIREDERQRVMAEMRGDGRDSDMADTGTDRDGRTGDMRADDPNGDMTDPRGTDRDGRVGDTRAEDRDGRMGDMRGDDRAGPATDDWRTTPPSEARFDEPRDRRHDDPRGYDVPDERTTRDERMVAREDRAVRRDDAARSDTFLEQRPWTAQDETVTERGFSPGQILIVLAGVASLALGIVAVARTGLNGPLSQPVKPVLGWNHTALLGLFEIGAGVLMILGGLRAGFRWFGGLVGLAVIVGGVLILGQLNWAVTHLGAERNFGWVAIIIGAVAVIGAAIPRIRRTHRRTTTSSSEPMATY